MNRMVRISQSKVYWMALLAVAALALPLVARAQTGCTDSPENPTAVLALVGSGGAFLSYTRRRFKARRRQSGE
jgi:XrtJ-associated TM-motif-TM protein